MNKKWELIFDSSHVCPELLSPVQDFVSLRAAIDSGADSIYFGTKELNMRVKAKNFELRDIKKVVELSHKNGVKAYFTLNTVIYDDEINKIRRILKKLKKERIDAIICWDYSIMDECERLNLPIHLSTQASISNFQALKTVTSKFKNIKRINVAREVSLEQIETIIKKIKTSKNKELRAVEIETFIHGAMCVSISGRCFLSQEIFNKSANRGECIQPCRRKYLIKDIEEDHEFELGEDYIISPKDLCTIEIVDRLIKAGIHAFKIEGRNRSPEYVRTTTECYREAIDTITKKKKLDQKTKNNLTKKLKTVYNRGFSTGFYLGKPLSDWSRAYGSKATKKKVYVGKVRNFYKNINVAEISVEAHSVKKNDKIMFQGPTTGVIEQTIVSMETNHNQVSKAEKGEKIAVKTDNAVRKNDKVFLFR